MDKFYFLVTNLKHYKRCEWDILKGFFETDNGFLMVFLLTVGIALVSALIFYTVMGRNFSLSKPGYWLGMLILSGVLSFGATTAYSGIGTKANAKYGLAAKINSVKKDKTKRRVDAKEVKKTSAKLQKNLLKFGSNQSVQTLAMMNGAYGMILFYVFSLVFKHEPITKFATEIPHHKP